MLRLQVSQRCWLGLNKLSALEPAEPIRRYEREHPGELIHVDIKKLGLIGSVGHRITGRYPGALVSSPTMSSTSVELSKSRRSLNQSSAIKLMRELAGHPRRATTMLVNVNFAPGSSLVSVQSRDLEGVPDVKLPDRPAYLAPSHQASGSAVSVTVFGQ